MIGYGALRFGIELLRDDPERGLFGPDLPRALVAGLGALVLSASLASGPVQSISGRWRKALITLTLVAPLAVYGLLSRWQRPTLAFSTSEIVGLLSAAAAGLLWRRLAVSGRPLVPPAPASAG